LGHPRGAKQQPSLWDDGKLRMAAAALVGVR
jgi:hypothetical protein